MADPWKNFDEETANLRNLLGATEVDITEAKTFWLRSINWRVSYQ